MTWSTSPCGSSATSSVQIRCRRSTHPQWPWRRRCITARRILSKKWVATANGFPLSEALNSADSTRHFCDTTTPITGLHCGRRLRKLAVVISLAMAQCIWSRLASRQNGIAWSRTPKAPHPFAQSTPNSSDQKRVGWRALRGPYATEFRKASVSWRTNKPSRAAILN